MGIEVDDERRGGLGARLHEQRLKQGLSQQQMADAIGISLHSYSRWEQGRVKVPKPAYLSKAAELLDTTPRYLLEGDASPAKDELEELLERVDKNLSGRAGVLRKLSAQVAELSEKVADLQAEVDSRRRR